MVLQVKGVPVLVAPESMLKDDTMTSVGLGEMRVGLDDLQFVATSNLAKPLDDNLVTLQVNGVPVLVAPESMLKEDTMTEVGLGEMRIGIDDLQFVQRPNSDENVVLSVHGSPVTIAPESMLRTNT